MEPEPGAWIPPARSAGWGVDGDRLATGARARHDATTTDPEINGRVAYLDVPEGAVGVAALVKIEGSGGEHWEIQTVGISDHELLGALRVQMAKLERRLADS
ncbi:hypothetical protein ACF3NT_10485 [Naumannella halotolerans]|uniref:hypothetical protein n=1 Tax=Naumannella halotolerans TaxID=993414 RepID=UPI00370D720D